MGEGGEGGHEDDLEERCTDDDLGRHAQKVDHGRHHDEPAAHAHDRGKEADDGPDGERGQDADVKTRGAELHLERQAMHPSMHMAAADGCAGFGAEPCAQAFLQHHRADEAEEEYVGKLDEQVDLAERGHLAEDPDARAGTEEAAHRQHRAHRHVDRLALQLREHARNRGGHHLIGPRGHRHGRGDADEEEERCDQEAAAHAEHARQEAHDPAQPQNEEGVDRNLGDGKVKLHGWPLRKGGDLPRVAPLWRRCQTLAALIGDGRDNVLTRVPVLPHRGGPSPWCVRG